MILDQDGNVISSTSKQKYNFYKWSAICNKYSEYLKMSVETGKFLTTEQMKNNVLNCFYYRLEENRFILYVSIINSSEDIILPGIKKILRMNGKPESEFDFSDPIQESIASLKCMLYQSLSVQALATNILVLDVWQRSKLEEKEVRSLVELQSLGIDVADKAIKIFGIQEDQRMYYYSQYLQDHFLENIERKGNEERKIQEKKSKNRRKQ